METKHQTFTSHLVVLSIFFVISIILWSGLLYFVRRQSADIADMYKEIAVLESQESDLHSLQATIRDTTDKREKVSSFFVHEEDAAVFLESIESLANRSGVTMHVSGFEKLAPESALRLSVTAAGSFPALFRFMTLIEHMPLELSIERTSISLNQATEAKSSTTTPKWRGDFAIRLSSFISKSL